MEYGISITDYTSQPTMIFENFIYVGLSNFNSSIGMSQGNEISKFVEPISYYQNNLVVKRGGKSLNEIPRDILPNFF